MQVFTTSTTRAEVQQVDGEEWELFKSMHSDLDTDPYNVRARVPYRTVSNVFSRQVVYKTSGGTYIVIHITSTSFTQRDFAAPARYSDSSPSDPCYDPTELTWQTASSTTQKTA